MIQLSRSGANHVLNGIFSFQLTLLNCLRHNCCLTSDQHNLNLEHLSIRHECLAIIVKFITSSFHWKVKCRERSLFGRCLLCHVGRIVDR